ncbi:hypothetical protein CK218_12810 [Mesorhizobium sp. WSM3879]|nr:hypothetical protein CK218_12810 [Mesorhizobium sp. WSM3879]
MGLLRRWDQNTKTLLARRVEHMRTWLDDTFRPIVAPTANQGIAIFRKQRVDIALPFDDVRHLEDAIRSIFL